MAWRAIVTGNLKVDPTSGALAIGAVAQLTKQICSSTVQTYADLLGDTNPVHLDDEYASKSRWGKRIAHGMISAGLIPTVFGSTIPGSIYVSQQLKFKAPVYVGDTVTATIKVLDIKTSPKHHLVTCQTNVVVVGNRGRREGEEVDDDKKNVSVTVIEGQAVVMLPNTSISKGGLELQGKEMR